MENYIIISPIGKSISGLSGNDNGEMVYKKNSNSIDLSKKLTIKFDDSIRLVSESFIQGFFNEIIKTKDKSYLNDVEIIAGNDFLKNMIIKYIERL